MNGFEGEGSGFEGKVNGFEGEGSGFEGEVSRFEGEGSGFEGEGINLGTFKEPFSRYSST